MKRLILLATMMVAVLASCEKHEIRNEVLTEIGFESKVGKQTKAIAQNGATGPTSAYLTDQPFGVFGYGHQDNNSNPIMKNTPIVFYNSEWKDGYTTNGNAGIADTTYYWPNSPSTTINFYAYSPYVKYNHDDWKEAVTANLANHQKINGVISHNESSGLTLTNYKHSNMYVDFMVATPVIGAKYNTIAVEGTVPMTFNHQLTQLIFNVKTSQEYNGITFTINSITLDNIHKQGTYTNGNLNLNSNSTFANGSWNTTLIDNDKSYSVFPAVKFDATSATDGAPDIQTSESPKTVTNSEALTTTPITVIPQTLSARTQSVTINYSISGTGVASENVSRTVFFNGITNNAQNATPLVWDVNKKITYNILIGLNEIKFDPVVANWSPEESANQTIIQ